MQKSLPAFAALVMRGTPLVLPMPALSQDGPAGLAVCDIPAPLPEDARGTPNAWNARDTLRAGRAIEPGTARVWP
jgi:hypothetical protein